MINFLQGILFERRFEGCTLLTPGGVGYELKMPAGGLERLPETGQELSLYVRTLVKEDAIELFGFLAQEEQEVFSLLISVSKLGPKTALAILSTFDPQSLRETVLREDIPALTRVPGIGQKSAKRLIWELKDKFEGWVPEAPRSGRPSGGRQTTFSDALAGLLNLGYKDGEVRSTLAQVLEQDPDLIVGEAIRAVLRQLKAEGNS